MAEVAPEVEADIVMWNALDKTRGGITERVNEAHGTDLSASTVSDVINAIENRAEDGDARKVYYRVWMRGIGASMGSDMADMFAGQY